MARKVGIIGTGWVGASVAISVLHQGIADELWLNDLRDDLAEGEAMDLAHGAAFYPAAQVRTASIEEMAQADAVVISAGRGGRVNETRLDLLRDNAATIAGIARRLQGARGLIIVVTNPVDVLTRVVAQTSGLPTHRVIGTGTFLDTARLRQVLSRELRVDARSVHAHVVGEHGDSEVVLWSSARVGGLAINRWAGWNAARAQAVADEVRTAAYQIIQRKGATNHAIGLVTATLLRCLLRGERRILTVSRVQAGAAGLHDVALSLPTIVGIDGATEVLEPDMNDAERNGLHRSAGILQAAFAELDGV